MGHNHHHRGHRQPWNVHHGRARPGVLRQPVQLLGGLEEGGESSCGGSAGVIDYVWEQRIPNVHLLSGQPRRRHGDDGELQRGFLETCCDFMTVYDGPDNTAPVITTTNGDFTGVSFTATNPSGCLTFELTSDGSVSCATGALSPSRVCHLCRCRRHLWIRLQLVAGGIPRQPIYGPAHGIGVRRFAHGIHLDC